MNISGGFYALLLWLFFLIIIIVIIAIIIGHEISKKKRFEKIITALYMQTLLLEAIDGRLSEQNIPCIKDTCPWIWTSIKTPTWISIILKMGGVILNILCRPTSTGLLMEAFLKSLRSPMLDYVYFGKWSPLSYINDTIQYRKDLIRTEMDQSNCSHISGIQDIILNYSDPVVN